MAKLQHGKMHGKMVDAKFKVNINVEFVGSEINMASGCRDAAEMQTDAKVIHERKNLMMKMINFVGTKSGYQEKLKLLRMSNEINVKQQNAKIQNEQNK